MKMIAAVTSCPTGIAHTLMAAEALKKAAELLGHQIKVEMQGSAGTKNPLSEEDIAEADVILLATDIRVDTRRFLEKPIYETHSSEAILKPKAVIEAALALLPAETLPVSAPDWLNGMRGANALVLGVILGAMMAFDMGGPFAAKDYGYVPHD